MMLDTIILGLLCVRVVFLAAPITRRKIVRLDA
jgi:hypothetical protein